MCVCIVGSLYGSTIYGGKSKNLVIKSAQNQWYSSSMLYDTTIYAPNGGALWVNLSKIDRRSFQNANFYSVPNTTSMNFFLHSHNYSGWGIEDNEPTIINGTHADSLNLNFQFTGNILEGGLFYVNCPLLLQGTFFCYTSLN